MTTVAGISQPQTHRSVCCGVLMAWEISQEMFHTVHTSPEHFIGIDSLLNVPSGSQKCQCYDMLCVYTYTYIYIHTHMDSRF